MSCKRHLNSGIVWLEDGEMCYGCYLEHVVSTSHVARHGMCTHQKALIVGRTTRRRGEWRDSGHAALRERMVVDIVGIIHWQKQKRKQKDWLDNPIYEAEQFIYSSV